MLNRSKFLCGFGLILAACNQPPSKSAQTKKVADTVFNTIISTEEKSVSAANLIVPGKGIGKISLKENAQEVYKTLGKPDSGDAAMGKSLSAWYANHDPAGYQTQVFCSRSTGKSDETTSRVKQIRVTSPYFKTKEGIGAGSTLKEIYAVFKVKKTVSYDKKKPPYAIYDSEKGIAFEIDNNQKCTSVMVYLPGDRGGITYLSFHP